MSVRSIEAVVLDMEIVNCMQQFVSHCNAVNG